MNRRCASVSLDLDNLWSYMKTHGDPGWETFPSYLDVVVPHILELLGQNGWRITFFVVGQDAALAANRPALQSLVAAGHEIGNHSFRHEPWLQRYSRLELEDELAAAEAAIQEATGVRPRMFRGPGFSCSTALLDVLQRRGYRLDASVLPTWLGPLARRYYLLRSPLRGAERAARAQLFGHWRDGLRPVAPYWWSLPSGPLLEIPVTTMPFARIPFHLSYILYLSTYSPWLARHYFRWALRLCRWAAVEPSLLLHPLDFLGGDEVERLAFFPAMGLPGAEKRRRVLGYLRDLAAHFEIVPMGEHAKRLAARDDLARRAPDLAAGLDAAPAPACGGD